MGFWPVTKKVLKDADIVLLILDVRMPELSRNSELERKGDLYDKKLVYVFNKIDLVSLKYLNFIKDKYPDAFYVSGTNNIGINELRRDLLIMAKRMKVKEPKIGVVGYPNVGKSAIINALAKRARAKVAAYAGTTRGIQWIRAGSLLVLDSPGVVPYQDSGLMLGVLGAKNIEKIGNVERVAFEIIKMFLNYDKSVFENCYGIVISDIEDFGLILEDIGRKKGFLLKGGIVDERRAALAVIHDWHKGKLRL